MGGREGAGDARPRNALARARKSGKVGVLFRREPGKAFAPHRNRLESNRILDSGPADGVAIDVQGETEDVTIRGNDVRETRGRSAPSAIARRSWSSKEP